MEKSFLPTLERTSLYDNVKYRFKTAAKRWHKIYESMCFGIQNNRAKKNVLMIMWDKQVEILTF